MFSRQTCYQLVLLPDTSKILVSQNLAIILSSFLPVSLHLVLGRLVCQQEEVTDEFHEIFSVVNLQTKGSCKTSLLFHFLYRKFSAY